MRKEAGVLLIGGLLALAGCGGKFLVVTRTVTVPSKTATPQAPGAPSAPASPTATPSALAATAIAGLATAAGSGLGSAFFGPAVLAAAVTPPAIAGSPQASTGSPQSSTATPATIPTHVIAASATGQYAVAHTNGSFRRPAKIVLKVTASPAQPGSVYWAIVCSEVGGGVGRQAKEQKLQLPISEMLPIPAPSTYCIASANVQLSKSGTVSISITG